MWLLLTIIALMPFEDTPYLRLADSFLGVPDIRVIKVLGVIGVAWATLRLVSGQARLGFFASAQGRAFAAFVFFTTCAALASGAVGRSSTRLLSLVLFAPIVLSFVRRERDVWRAFRAMALILIAVFPYAVRQMIRFDGRYGIGLNEPNYTAIATLLAVPVAFVFWRRARSLDRRLGWLLGLATLLAALALSGSRGGLVGVVVVLALLAVKVARRPALGLAALAALLILIVVVPNPVGHRTLATLGLAQDTGVEGSNRHRSEILAVGLRMVRAEPLFGVGLGNFKAASTEYGAATAQIAHSTYLELAAELGLPACAAFCAVLVAAFRSLGRSARLALLAGNPSLRDLAAAVRAGLLGYAASALFLSAQYEKFLWLVLFLTIPLERVAREQARRALEAEPEQRSAA
jgi:O-antigen ligase